MYMCLCKGLTESDVLRVAQKVGMDPAALTTALKLDDEECCGRCARNIEELVMIANACLVGSASTSLRNLRSGSWGTAPS
jgi:bacterioferritin-associated ferredoxin